MKKFFTFLIVALCLFNPLPAFADGRGTLVDGVLLDNSPTSVTSDGLQVGKSDKVTFIVTYDETEVGASVSAAVTLEISYDNTNFFAASFHDLAGGATLQTSETISADSRYIFWMPRDLAVPYARVKVTGTNTDADDTALITVNYYLRG